MRKIQGFCASTQKTIDTAPCDPYSNANAQMAELVDAPASGAGTRKGVEVRVLFWAPISCFRLSEIVLEASQKPANPGFFVVWFSSDVRSRPLARKPFSGVRHNTNRTVNLPHSKSEPNRRCMRRAGDCVTPVAANRAFNNREPFATCKRAGFCRNFSECQIPPDLLTPLRPKLELLILFETFC